MISPQGYKLGEDPKSKNPFWGNGEDSDVNRIYATASVDEGTGVPSVTTSKTVSGNDITFGFDFHNLKGKDGDPGKSGFSPSARVEQTETGATITITDKSGTTTASVNNGAPGKSGFSPSARVEQTETGATITITDKSGTTTATVNNGAPGKVGDPGAQGEPGPAGPGVPAGGTAGQVLTKVDGTDYNTEWKDPTGGSGSAQIVQWVDNTDSIDETNIFPRHEYSGYNFNDSDHTGSELNSIPGNMGGITYDIRFSDNVHLTIPASFEYDYDSVVVTPFISLDKDHSSDKHYASLTIPNVETDIIISAEGQSPVKAQGHHLLSCTVKDGSTVFINGTINTDTGTIIINESPLLHFSSEYVNKYEVLKTV